MKRWILGATLTLVLLAAAAAQAEAQGVTIEYKKRTKDSSLVVSFSGGYTSGYGYGTGVYLPYYAGWGGGGVVRVGSCLYPYAYRPRYYEPYSYGSRPIYNYAPVYSKSPDSAERLSRARAQKDVEEGLRRFRSADYAAALQSFKRAFIGEPDGSAVQLYLGLALIGVGDAYNADKAFRRAFESLTPEEALGANLPGLFQTVREEEKYVAGLDRSRLSAGVVFFLMGRKAEARSVLKKFSGDPAAGKCLALLPE